METFASVVSVHPLARAALVFIASAAALLLLRSLLIRRLHVFAARTSTRIDDLVLSAISAPSVMWCVAGGLEAAVLTSALDAELRDLAATGLAILIVGSMTLVTANIAAGALELRLGADRPQGGLSGIGRALVRGVVLFLGAALLLHALGVAITPLLTALGVGGLAVALAMQDTLSNFFAGVHILLEKPFGIGHFIRIEDGDEGYVLDIGWRTTRIRTLLDHTIVVPNAKIAGSIIQNMYLPDPAVRSETKVGVTYDADPAAVEAILLDEMRTATQEVPELLAEPAPDVLLEELGAYALQYTVRFQVKEISLQRVARHAVNTRIVTRLRKEGIDIPFPVQSVLVRTVP